MAKVGRTLTIQGVRYRVLCLNTDVRARGPAFLLRSERGEIFGLISLGRAADAAPRLRAARKPRGDLVSRARVLRHGWGGDGLRIAGEVENVDRAPFEYEAALHTYVAVSNVENVALAGLGGTRYLDKVDAGWQRAVVVEKRGSDATVVWNPWLAKASAMADLGSEAWRSFVCVEAARVRPNPVSLAPGAAHAMSTRIEIRPGHS